MKILKASAGSGKTYLAQTLAKMLGAAGMKVRTLPAAMLPVMPNTIFLPFSIQSLYFSFSAVSICLVLSVKSPCIIQV